MDKTYQRLLQNLNTVKWELKSRNDATLNLCIKYIQDAIFEVGRINDRLMMLEAANASRDDADCWSDD